MQLEAPTAASFMYSDTGGDGPVVALLSPLPRRARHHRRRVPPPRREPAAPHEDSSASGSSPAMRSGAAGAQ